MNQAYLHAFGGCRRRHDAVALFAWGVFAGDAPA